MPFQPNKKLLATLIPILRDVATEFALRIEAAAKAELYPGHGKLTGILQRSITAEQAVHIGNRIRARVRTRGVPYAKRIDKRYDFMKAGFEKSRNRLADILRSKAGART